jgi:hypothetical protein
VDVRQQITVVGRCFVAAIIFMMFAPVKAASTLALLQGRQAGQFLAQEGVRYWLVP